MMWIIALPGTLADRVHCHSWAFLSSPLSPFDLHMDQVARSALAADRDLVVKVDARDAERQPNIVGAVDVGLLALRVGCTLIIFGPEFDGDMRRVRARERERDRGRSIEEPAVDGTEVGHVKRAAGHDLFLLCGLVHWTDTAMRATVSSDVEPGRQGQRIVPSMVPV